jgi:hypothetical protein
VNTLKRYGIEWTGPKTPIAVPMKDGHWTPWHLAQEGIAELEKENADVYGMLDDIQNERNELRAEVAELEKERDQILNSALDSESNFCDLKERIAELEQYYQMVVYAGFIMEDSEGVAGYHLNGDVADWDSLFTYSLYKEAVAKRDLEQQRKGFWLGFEDARCHPDEMNILNQWENTKVFIESKGGAE